MTERLFQPEARLTVVTLGVKDVRKSAVFYESLGFMRKLKVTGDEVAFFETGGSVLALYAWDKLALDVTVPEHPRPSTFRGSSLAWNCRTEQEVDATLAFAVARGASMLKPAKHTNYGGYSGYFADLDGHPWEVVVAPGLDVGDDGRVHLPD